MEPPSWPLYVFYGIEIPSLPLYFMVLICLLRLRCYSKTYQSTFYTILLQHCIADIIIMIFYTATWGLRTQPGIRDFLFEYQEYYIAAALYNSIYYTLYIRCTGIVFLSVHRYLVISAPTSRITSIIQDAATWQIVLVYWAAPTIISLVVLKETKIKYDNVTTLEYVVDKEILSRNTLMALITLSSTCLICIACYMVMWIIIRKHKHGNQNISRSLQREFFLAFQVLALLCAFFIMFTYYALVNYFSRTQNTGPIFYMRSVYPIANGILSYINPYCVLLLNRDFSKQFRGMLKCRQAKKRELYLAFQVLALLCAFFVMFLYYLLQNYFSQTQNSGPVYTMRALYPISNGILSYINPYCVLFLNREFCRQFMRTLKCEGVRVSEVKVSTVTAAPLIHRNSRA
ncbi:unnamed protein product [Caenorhabditis nigoni]